MILLKDDMLNLVCGGKDTKAKKEKTWAEDLLDIGKFVWELQKSVTGTVQTLVIFGLVDIKWHLIKYIENLGKPDHMKIFFNNIGNTGNT